MREHLKSVLAVALCAATPLAAMPTEVLAGPTSVSSPTTVGLTASVENAHYRRHYYHRRYYRHYGYDPSGAIFAGAALGLMSAGIAAASRPHYYYGYGYPYYYGYGCPGYCGWGW